MRPFLFFTALFIIASSCSTSQAILYQWTDEDGVLHFSDTPR